MADLKALLWGSDTAVSTTVSTSSINGRTSSSASGGSSAAARIRALRELLADDDEFSDLAPKFEVGAKQGGAGFELHRVGDAVACRNIHAAIYDSLRLMKNI